MPLQMKQMTVQPTADMIAAQRQQEIASLLMQQALKQPAAPQGGMFTPKMGALQALAPAITGLLASHAQDNADTSTKTALTSQQAAQNQALADVIGGGAQNQAQPPADASQPSAQPQAAGAIPGVGAGPGTTSTQQQPNFMGALRAQQTGVPAELLGEILKSQAPTDKIKTMQQGGMSGEDIARAIRGETAKDSTMTVGSDSRVVDPLTGKVTLGAEDKLPSGMRMGAGGQPEWIPGYLQGEGDMRRAGAPSVSVNTEKSLYGTLGEKQGAQYSDQFAAAQSAPEAIAGTQRVRDLLASTKGIPYTGTGAQWKLAVGKAAKAAGFNYADDEVANTEALQVEMAKATLAQVRQSGLGAGQGFSNADRDFLEKSAGGNQKLEPKTISRLADLNERAARVSIKRWNDTYSGLDPARMQQLGMRKIDEPQATPNAPIIDRQALEAEMRRRGLMK